MLRREFLATASLSALAAQTPSARFMKGICAGIFRNSVPLADRIRQVKNAGFDGIEIGMGEGIAPEMPADDVKRLADVAEKAKVAVVSVWVSGPLSKTPLNHPDPAVRAKGVETLGRSVEIARLLNCGAMLIVPGRLGDGARFRYGYQDTWERVTESLRAAIPAAEKAKVVLTPENVWNKFLVSPLEMRAFVDQFHSPWLKTHFDTGNVMQFGYPQDWILTLGRRIERVHVKDYKLSARAEQGRFVELLQGDVDWKEVMAALVKTGYRGFISPEVGPDANDPDRLNTVSKQLDKILSLA